MKIQIEFNIKSFFRDIVKTYISGIRRALRFIVKHWIKSLIILAVFIILAIFISWTAAFFWSFFLAFLIMRLDSRVPIAAALFCLSLCPFLLLLKDQLGAEQIAIWAYYFLAIGVVLQIGEFSSESVEENLSKRESKRKEIARGIFLPDHRKQCQRWFKGVVLGVGGLIAIICIVGILIARNHILGLLKMPEGSRSFIQEESHQSGKPKIDKSMISITILNGNGIPGAAAKMKEQLEEEGFRITTIGDALRWDYPCSFIYYQPGALEEAKLLREALKDRYKVVIQETASSQETEIVIIVGQR